MKPSHPLHFCFLAFDALACSSCQRTGGQHHSNTDADGSLCTNCLGILLWMDISCVICFLTAHNPASLFYCDCLAVKYEVFADWSCPALLWSCVDMPGLQQY
ncbi:hypothetical protein VPH35_053056 [Triticum aestivum]